jgi:hypothetical protein
VPYEHVVYADKGIAAITLTASNAESQTTPIQKFSILDRELCTCKLMSVLDILSEAIVQTIVTEEVQNLDVLLLTDSEGKAHSKTDKSYIKHM